MRYILISLLMLFAIYMSGCSGGGVLPDISDGPDSAPGTMDPGISPRTYDGHESARVPLGLFSITVDPEAQTLEIVPVRTVEQHLNAIPFLEAGAEQLVQLANPPEFSNGGKQLDVKIRIMHPHADLIFTGFDIHGIFITEGSLDGWHDPDVVIAGPDETRLMNPDGMTRWWNPSEFTIPGLYGYKPGVMGGTIPGDQAATLNGYKTFTDGFGAYSEMSDLFPDLRGMFSVSGNCVRHYKISLASGLQFNYAVDASWAFPTSVPPVPPDDFPAKANMAEAYWIDVDEWLNTFWWEDGTGYGGNVFYNVTVHDWQGADTIGTARIEIPAIGVNAALTELIDEGPNHKSYEYSVVLPELQSNDSLDVLISVDSSDGGYQPGVTGVDKPLRAYQLHLTEVADVNPGINLDPICVMQATGETDILIGGSVTFDAGGSYDPDGAIVDYSWDFDGDESYGDPWDSGTELNPTKIFDEYGSFDVRCRIEDNQGAFGTSPPVCVTTDYSENQSPIAIAEATSDTTITYGQSVTFDASGSYDPDGTVDAYEWDFDGDGNYGDAYDAGTDTAPEKIYYTKSVFEVDLRVVDNEGADGFLDETITVTVINTPPVADAEFTTEPPYYESIEYSISAVNSLDIDGTIESYEWDTEYDGITFNPTQSGEEIQVQWDTPGDYSIMLRVVDDDGAEDFLDASLNITIFTAPEIIGIKVTYEDSQKVTWTITGSGFTDTEGEIVSDLPDGWDAEIVSWANDEIVCKYAPYSMDVTAKVVNGGIETNEWFIPESDGILVIYNINSTISGQIKDYYVSPVTGRGIPPEHVLGLDAADSETVSRDTYNSLKDDIEWWLMFHEVQYEVKYIVTCKGVPLRISKVSGSGTTADFACFDSELCVLFETYDILGRKHNAYYSYTTPKVFHPGKHSYGGLTVRYITTRLTGYTYEEVTAMIDRCMDPYTGDDVWHILDGDPDIWYDYMDQAAPLMTAAGLNVYYDDTNTFVTAVTIDDATISDHVMTYTGHGIHHSPNPGKWYIIDDLEFTYPNGALFNSYESFNGTTFTWTSHSGHGMVGDFIRMGGCGGIGHVYEPYSDGVGDERCIARWYERGYNLAEAQYLGLRYVSWTEVVIGEPLCRIASWDG